MNELIGRVISFEKQVFPNQSALYARLADKGQSPKALIISCADSRVVPEHLLQAEPGDLFVCRNAGNIVPPYSNMTGGVSATVEYAVMVLGVSDIIVCGHSDCGAMKALMNPEMVEKMPNVAAWLRHGAAARSVVDSCYPELHNGEAVRVVGMENVVAQIANLRTHPSVSGAIGQGKLSLHGWFFDIQNGVTLGLDGETGRFTAIKEDSPLPIALEAGARRAADYTPMEAAA
ncbi:carbonic anhydrase [Sphingomonas sp. Leaf357]|uniref:carbonic anhydrase n=1 Tax=Sphingomonas sp. Leaf357 TaxID=1736350 RepID=UPI0006FC5C22|nr:carbonic anhydrase [Sphingomonas sp. Leaf357]KQS04307.1 carbonic anhydrase [Sphingomonas sp. Leaf357]